MTAATLKASVAISETGAGAIGQSVYWNGALEYLQVLSDGTTAGKADLSYVAEIEVATGANSDIDLAGSLTNALGESFAAAELVAIMIKNIQLDGTANTTDLTLDGSVTASFVGFLDATSTIGPIKPGGVFFMAAGDADGIGAVAATTADILRITNSSGATNKFMIAILARSA
ncbi:hypothetical protein OEG84_25090 [Hoeflea sp. G2-23]|uniref:Uncharacterized protein n=1 Tax=Hoeflea algicola TaxID=2983763 RepID=A0ABT3ZGF4_9HYPH|nr:hypothetical protein [Hoeflea algicola]MCY0150884.1 hypothetical protein [Hoeflea algicola]